VLSLRPDLASLTMSSLNFPKQASINAPDTILQLIEQMNIYGVNPEVECFDSGMLNYANYLLKKGVLPNPLYINVIFGNLFNAQADLATVAALLPQLPPGAKTCFGGIGSQQLKATVLGLLEADGVRVGLEDNLYIRGREKATNSQLLQRTHALMHDMDMTLLPSKTFRQSGYGNKQLDYSWQE
jgi:3-keto-5-aminohexanoate cleavage enzyme